MPTDRKTRSLVNPSDLTHYFNDLNIDDDYDCDGPRMPTIDEIDDSESWVLVEHKNQKKRHQMWAEKERLIKAAAEIEDFDRTMDSLELEGFTDHKRANQDKYARKGDGSRRNVKELKRLRMKLRLQKRNERIRKNEIEPHADEVSVQGDTLAHEPAEIDLRREERRKLAHAAVDTPPQNVECDQSEELSQLLDSIHDIANTDGDSQMEEWVSHLENLVIMAYQVSRAQSFVDVFVAVVAYIKMNTKKCVLKHYCN
jgi:hypothetical protein